MVRERVQENEHLFADIHNGNNNGHSGQDSSATREYLFQRYEAIFDCDETVTELILPFVQDQNISIIRPDYDHPDFVEDAYLARMVPTVSVRLEWNGGPDKYRIYLDYREGNHLRVTGAGPSQEVYDVEVGSENWEGTLLESLDYLKENPVACLVDEYDD